MKVEYHAKAVTDLHILADGKGIDWSELGRITVPVAAVDNTNRKVFSAEISMQVGEKKSG
jgi:hypothetical protein